MFWGGGVALPEFTHNDTIVAASQPDTRSHGWRRQRFLVDARYQLRAGVMVGAVALVLLMLLNVSLIVQARAAAKVAPPSVRHLLAGSDRASSALVLVGSLVFLGGVILIGVLESHRTAGAAYAIRRAVDAIREGQPGIRVRLRRCDHFQDLANSVNRLAETIDAGRAQRG